MTNLRKLRIVLLASLLVNLFLVGLLVGGALQFRTRSPMIMAGSLRIVGSELPPAERLAFRTALQRTRFEQRERILESKDAKEQAAQLLSQPNLDQDAVIEALGRARAADMAVRTAVEQRAVTFAQTLRPADRARLSDAMHRRAQQNRDILSAPAPR